MSAAMRLEVDVQPRELARLVREQAADAERFRLLPREHEVREADLGRGSREVDRASLDRFIAPPADPAQRVLESDEAERDRRGGIRRPLLLVGVSGPWGAAELAYDPKRGQPCPACHDHPRRKSYCLVCSRSGRDQRGWPNAPAPVEHRVAAPRKSKPRSKPLAGGVGKARWADWVPPDRPEVEPAPRYTPAPPRPKPKRRETATAHVRVRCLVPIMGHHAGDLVEVRASIAEAYVASGAAERVR